MIITCINQKGGVGKTTTADTIMSYLKTKNIPALAVDLDPQANLTTAFNANMSDAIMDAFSDNLDMDSLITHTDKGDIITSSNRLRDAGEVLSKTGREFKLKKILDKVREENDYEYIVIDTPPSLDILTINALTATDKVVVVAQADVYSISGLDKLNEAIELVREYTNSNIKIDGILITRYNSRTNLSKNILQTFEDIAKQIGTRVYSTPIRETIKIKEVQAQQGNLFELSPKENVTKDYLSFVKELL